MRSALRRIACSSSALESIQLHKRDSTLDLLRIGDLKKSSLIRIPAVHPWLEVSSCVLSYALHRNWGRRDLWSSLLGYECPRVPRGFIRRRSEAHHARKQPY